MNRHFFFNRHKAFWLTTLFLLFLTAFCLVVILGYQEYRYRQGQKAMAAKDYESAAIIYSSISFYRDAKNQSQQAIYSLQYQQAWASLNGGEIEKAKVLFMDLASHYFKDARQLVNECDYRLALNMIKDKETYKAYLLLRDLGDYQDAEIWLSYCLKPFPSGTVVYLPEANRIAQEEFLALEREVEITLADSSDTGLHQDEYLVLTIRDQSGQVIVKAYIGKGDKVVIHLPEETYSLYAVMGHKLWFGQEDEFGVPDCTISLMDQGESWIVLEADKIYRFEVHAISYYLDMSE
ncbi:MAG: hypothetical protein LBR25_03365 [Erysipelotrichaceae bacterium]|jgi:tetratricopeptide (TPR) repeat protein|nr:hypothetical protein [Erysipelotrichaceae bacterium]